jgi:hypothetical protein
MPSFAQLERPTRLFSPKGGAALGSAHMAAVTRAGSDTPSEDMTFVTRRGSE